MQRLPDLLREQGGIVAGFGPALCVTAGMMARAHRDPFDCLPAATAQKNGVPTVSADTVFDGIVPRI